MTVLHIGSYFSQIFFRKLKLKIKFCYEHKISEKETQTKGL